MNCQRCGAPIQPGFIRCANCGLELQYQQNVQTYHPQSNFYPPQNKRKGMSPLAIISIVAGALVLVILLIAFLLPMSKSGSSTAPPDDSVVNNDTDIDKSGKFYERVIFDANGIKVTVTGWDATSGVFGSELLLFIENNTDRSIVVQCRDCSINDFAIEAIMSAEVPAGKKSNTSMTFLSSDLKDNGIEKVETIEFKLHIFDWDDWGFGIDSDIITVEL